MSISNIKELITFMDAEAAEWGREESDQLTVNGAGITRQWEDRAEFPYPVFYLQYDTDVEPIESPDGQPGSRKRVIFDIKSLWFDEDGNVTDRPRGNETPLYRNE
jgi:uncharacterized protein YfaP (DUF2135 family)